MDDVKELTVWGDAGSSSLVQREDLFKYHLAVRKPDADAHWKTTTVMLPDGRDVQIERYVSENFLHPRPLHPEYAFAIELLIANAVTQAKARGHRVVAVEMGVWVWKTFSELGRRLAKTGLAVPMLLEDGRTETLVGLSWVDGDGEGVALQPWANGDQLIRLKYADGTYYVPVDERTSDDHSFKAESWRVVCKYPALGYASEAPMVHPMLDAGEEMPLVEACENCLFMHPVGSLERECKARKMVCEDCWNGIAAAREEARLQGWDYDKGIPLPAQRPMLTAAHVGPGCEHRWGMQMWGTSNGALPEEQRAVHGQQISRECILCGAPAPAPN